MKIKIKYSAGVIEDTKIIEEVFDAEEADAVAYKYATELYELYIDNFRSIKDIMKEENIDDYEIAYEIFVEERDSQITYSWEEIKED